MRLYTIPYAGGFAFTYLKWKKYLDKKISLHALEFPGRFSKSNEPLCRTIEEMADYIYPKVNTMGGDYALFGHSMGALVLIELYDKLKRSGHELPKRVIISGMKPPHLRVPRNYHLLDEESFKIKLFEMGGIPREVAADEAFADHLFKLLRNDFKAVEEYRVTEPKTFFECPVSLFNSESDISFKTMMEWENYTLSECDYYPFKGSHFFINEHMIQVIEEINRILCSVSVKESRLLFDY